MGKGGLALAVVVLAWSGLPAVAQTPPVAAPHALTVDGLAAPIGLGLSDVYFGWQLATVETAYSIVVSQRVLDGPDRRVWDSGLVRSTDQTFVPYDGPALAPDTAYAWTVQTWDASLAPGPVSAPATFETGLRDSDWRAAWIKRATVEVLDTAATFQIQSNLGVWLEKDEYSYVRTERTLRRSPIVRARAYVSADQQYELYVNGDLAGKGQAYQFPDSAYYETVDVTKLLRAGAANAFGLIYSWQGPGKGRPEGTPAAIVEVSILHADGTTELVATDGSWKVLAGAWLPGTQRDLEGDPVDYTENIAGPAIPVGWDMPGFNDVGWLPATVIGRHPVAPFTHLVPVRTRIVYASVAPVSVKKLASGSFVVDFGKVYTALPAVTFHAGSLGRLVRMHAGFLLDPDGQVSTTRGTQHTDMSYSYVERGGVETFRPFDYLAFRYLQVDAPGEALRKSDIVALARHTVVPDEHAATFSSSNPTVDAVFALGAHSALYTAQDQFVDTPTREKGAWLWDGRNESMTTMAAFGEQNLTRKDLLEFAQSQSRYWPNGAINKIYPTALGALDIPEFAEIYPEWVWQYWMDTGDRALLSAVFPVLVNVANYVWSAVSPSTGLVTNLQGTSNLPPYATDTTINVLGANVLRRAADAADALGRPAAVLRARQTELTNAINHRLVQPAGLYRDGADPRTPTSQETNAFALAFGVVPPDRVSTVAAYVASRGMAVPPMSAGDMLQALRVGGRTADMVRIISDASQPGWANILARGGTFTWEVWNPSDSHGDSMSHGWGANVLVAIQQGLLGVVPTAPGFAKVEITPPPSGLDWAAGSVPTPRGPITVHWTRTGGTFNVDVTLPPGITAVAHLGQGAPISIGAGTHHVTTQAGAPKATVVPVEPAPPAASVVASPAGPYPAVMSGRPITAHSTNIAWWLPAAAAIGEILVALSIVRAWSHRRTA